MKTRLCPFCGEKIKRIAVFCRYCRHELPPLSSRRASAAGWLPAVMAAALIVSGSAFLVTEFLKERRCWLSR